jgi:hypothetical protein
VRPGVSRPRSPVGLLALAGKDVALQELDWDVALHDDLRFANLEHDEIYLFLRTGRRMKNGGEGVSWTDRSESRFAAD